MDDKQLLLEKIFLKNPKFGIELISQYFELSHNLIDEYIDVLNLKNGVSQNQNVIFDIDFIDKFNDKWNWGVLQNNNLPWSLDFIKSHYILESKIGTNNNNWIEKLHLYLGWNWRMLAYNDNIPWSIELFWEFRNRWGYQEKSCFDKIKWTIDSLEKYECILIHFSLKSKKIEINEPKYFIKSERNLEFEREDWIEFTNSVRKKKKDIVEKKYETKILIDTTYFLPFQMRYKKTLDWKSISASENIDWSIELIEYFENKWDWDNLSNNNLNWNSNLIAKFKSNWNWNYLSANKQITWTKNMIFENQNDFNWNCLSQIQNLPWSIELIDCFLEKWNWKYLSENLKLPWSIEFIERYCNYWEWESLSRNTELPWSIQFFEKYKENWNWESLSGNPSLPWSSDFFEKYNDKWDFIELSYFNTNIPLSLEILVKYKDRWNWEFMSENSNLPWSINFIDVFQKYLHWDKVQNKFFFGERVNCSYNYLIWDKPFITKFIDVLLKRDDESISFLISNDYRIIWDLELIEKYNKKIDFKSLSNQQNILWSIELIKKYNDYWDWSSLSSNHHIDFSTEIIDEFVELWNWNGLSSNTNLKFTLEFINRYKNKWDWNALSHNPSVKWDINLLNTYSEKLKSSKYIWNQIKTNIDEIFVKSVLSKIRDNIDESELVKITENENKTFLDNSTERDIPPF